MDMSWEDRGLGYILWSQNSRGKEALSGERGRAPPSRIAKGGKVSGNMETFQGTFPGIFRAWEFWEVLGILTIFIELNIC